MALGVDDATRAARAMKGIEGKRLTYHQPSETAHEEAEGSSLYAVSEGPGVRLPCRSPAIYGAKCQK
jgi:hypothetical protein